MRGEIRRALANETRLRILKALREKPLTYTDLMVSVGMDVEKDRGKFTYHLNLLKDAELIGQEGDVYKVTKQGIAALATMEERGERVRWDIGLMAGLLSGVFYGLIKPLDGWILSGFFAYLSYLPFSVAEGVLIGVVVGIAFAVAFRILPGRTAILKSLVLSMFFFVIAFIPSFFYMLYIIMNVSGNTLGFLIYVQLTRLILVLISWLTFGILLGFLWKLFSSKPTKSSE